MSFAEQLAENLYTFPIRLPENPLKWLNCYVIRGLPGERSLLIDTGFNRAECLEDLMRGMEELKMKPEETDVFFTHLHADHTGNAAALQKLGSRLLMSATDIRSLQQFDRGAMRLRMLREGMPAGVLEATLANNQGRRFSSPPFEAEPLQDGDRLCCGGYELTCLLTPGHTPGHLCLYAPGQQVLFTGDHVLFDITPNITWWTDQEDALGVYLESLMKIRDLPVKLALPGHRNIGSLTLRERTEQLLAHHERRLNEAERIGRENPGICAYEIAGRMTWKIRARSWEEFPTGQKWFAMGEAFAHLDHLCRQGRIRAEENEAGEVFYFTAF